MFVIVRSFIAIRVPVGRLLSNRSATRHHEFFSTREIAVFPRKNAEKSSSTQNAQNPVGAVHPCCDLLTLINPQRK